MKTESQNPQELSLALSALGCESFAEYARLIGLDAANLADPCDRRLVEQAVMDNARLLDAYLNSGRAGFEQF